MSPTYPYLVGVADPDDTFRAVPVRHLGAPTIAVPTLANLWRATFARDTTALLDTLLAYAWSHLTDTPPHADACAVPGVGVTADQPDAASSYAGLLADPALPAGLRWAYLIDPATSLVTAYAGVGAHSWQERTALRLGVPAPAVPPCGGPTDGHHWSHAWVTLDSPAGPYPARVCTGPHFGGHLVAGFTTATADRIAADTQHASRTGTGSGPLLVRTGDGYETVWFPGTDDEHHQPVPRSGDGLHLVGRLTWPWRLATRPTAAPADHRPERVGRWEPAWLTHDGDRDYPGYLPSRRHDTGDGLAPRFTVDVAARIAADSYTDWCTHPNPTGGFYRVTDTGLAHLHRPATPDENVTAVEPDDGLFRLGADWHWQHADPT